MNTHPKSLLIRADFVLGNRPGGDRLSCKRWRRVLAEALPRLMGCAERCRKATVRLRDGEGEATYSGWLRIPVERRPNRKRLRSFKTKLRDRLEAGLRLVDGRVIKLGVRRYGPKPTGPVLLPLPDAHGKATSQLELFDPLGLARVEDNVGPSLDPTPELVAHGE